ncbi:hypothetical protein [Granulicella aggregans]|uniref:hypothetical protein n=1 Tax=Granulicella aggregans TaxID=474949 RepID=UPI0021E0F712|nr:hypothetical protein [Granulicella aggregans]
MQTDWKSIAAVLAPLLAAVVTAGATFVGTVIALLFAWFKERGESTKRSQVIREATDRVLFWKAWQELRIATANDDDLDSIRAKVREELDLVRAGFEQRIHIPSRPNSLMRRLLLLYKPYNEQVWLLRAAFYALLVFAIPGGVILGRICIGAQGDAIDHFGPMIVIHNQPIPNHLTWAYIEQSLDFPAVAGLITIISALGLFWLLLMTGYILMVLLVRWIALDLDKDSISEQLVKLLS